MSKLIYMIVNDFSKIDKSTLMKLQSCFTSYFQSGCVNYS
jgi:hypothetical protein